VYLESGTPSGTAKRAARAIRALPSKYFATARDLSQPGVVQELRRMIGVGRLTERFIINSAREIGIVILGEERLQDPTVAAPAHDAFEAHACPTCRGTGRVGELREDAIATFPQAFAAGRVVPLCSRVWWHFPREPDDLAEARACCDRPSGHDGRCRTHGGIEAPDGPVSR
jgi:hypothetical protein